MFRYNLLLLTCWIRIFSLSYGQYVVFSASNRYLIKIVFHKFLLVRGTYLATFQTEPVCENVYQRQTFYFFSIFVEKNPCGYGEPFAPNGDAIPCSGPHAIRCPAAYTCQTGSNPTYSVCCLGTPIGNMINIHVK